MAKNTNQGYRTGAVSDRSQTYNPVTQQYVKRDTTTGQFMSTSNTQYKGVTNEKK